MTYNYKTRGVCSSNISFNIENGIVSDVKFTGGCNGNAKALSALVQGMDANEVIKRLKDIKCGFRNTSCADQFANALIKAMQD